MHKAHIITAGAPLSSAGKALIMIHGRGATANSILTLADHLNVDGYTLFAPEATNNTWYPYSFLAPPAQNEPWLSSAVDIIDKLVADIEQKGISKERIYLLGFSQGACLTLEFAARHAARYGGIAAFTGGLIGDKIYRDNYKGDFAQTPVFIGSSNPDFHVPVERVYASANILREMGADVTEKIYDNMGHTIAQDELDIVNKLIFS
ncbi:alpha/beta hydrolase [Chitinophaga vietnamensis]|uniref:alpha/beta hydrolase n=1 Tax=Chitinophaga vietnamensis TaxID=2593957 RepID=UPI001178BDDE|nr:dienelactone hydrolase family protein [Chitinophaga vietnamensis]